MARTSLAFGFMGSVVLVGLIVTFFASPSVTPPPVAAIDGCAEKRLRAFRSEAELRAWFQEKTREAEEARKENKFASSDKLASSESITPTQSADVDEGGIVKLHGEHLVILRRGQLFTGKIGGDALSPVDMQDAFAPGSDGSDAWYDELLISGDTVVVIGYSYGKGGTELTLFRIA